MWFRGLSQCSALPGTGPARGLKPGPARGDNLLGLAGLTAAWTLGGPQAALKWAALLVRKNTTKTEWVDTLWQLLARHKATTANVQRVCRLAVKFWEQQRRRRKKPGKESWACPDLVESSRSRSDPYTGQPTPYAAFNTGHA